MTLSPSEKLHQALAQDQKITVDSVDLFSTLLHIEQDRKKQHLTIESRQFLGTWQLYFVGPKRSPQSASQSIQGQGKKLPSWIKILLSYETMNPDDSNGDHSQGKIRNRVQWGVVSLELTGPWMYEPRSQIMAFDFLFLTLSCFGRSLLSLPIRGGQQAEAKFWTQPLKEKAFFRYFWVTPTAIAARGRGGGIALWIKDSTG